jgi:hypothetical protein
MSRTYRAESKPPEPKRQPSGKMRRCDSCDSLWDVEEMYPYQDESGRFVGYLCEICSGDVELVEEIPDGDE